MAIKSRMATYGMAPSITGVALLGWVSSREAQSNVISWRAQRTAEPAEDSWHFTSLAVNASYQGECWDMPEELFCQYPCCLACSIGCQKKKEFFRRIKIPALRPPEWLFSCFAWHTVVSPDIWSPLLKLILGDKHKSVFYSKENLWEESELTVIIPG